MGEGYGEILMVTPKSSYLKPGQGLWGGRADSGPHKEAARKVLSNSNSAEKENASPAGSFLLWGSQ